MCTQLEVLSDWVNPMYLDVGIQSQIQLQFEAESQIELPDFLLVSHSVSNCTLFNLQSSIVTIQSLCY